MTAKRVSDMPPRSSFGNKEPLHQKNPRQEVISCHPSLKRTVLGEVNMLELMSKESWNSTVLDFMWLSQKKTGQDDLKEERFILAHDFR